MSCAPSYKFEGKERDSETQNDDFGARYYSWRVGRWLSADWSAVPAPVPYANLTNPQTLNLYAMVRDNPETFADLDGHRDLGALIACGPDGGACSGINSTPITESEIEAAAVAAAAAAAAQTAQTASAQPQTAESLATQVPSAVKSAIMSSVNASNAPSGADTTGGFHEESGVAGTTAAGALVVSPDKPGPYGNPDTSDHLSTTHKAVNQSERDSIANVTVMWHVHPSGQTATHNWKQGPSVADRRAAVTGPINIVVGARNRTVYFYNGGNMNLHMSLKQFMGTE